MAPGDWSIVDGGLATTKDGDIKVGDTIYNGLYRLVEAWRHNSPHLRFLFEMMKAMRVRRIGLDDKMNQVGEAKRPRFDIETYSQPDPLFTDAFHAVIDEQTSAHFGYVTYAGSLVMLLSGSLSRFRDDIEAKGDDWTKAAPLFNGCSLGEVIVAAANGTLKRKPATMPNLRPSPWRRDSMKPASDKPGAVQRLDGDVRHRALPRHREGKAPRPARENAGEDFDALARRRPPGGSPASDIRPPPELTFPSDRLHPARVDSPPREGIMARTYKAHRRFAPPVEEIVRMRQLGDPMEEIAARHGCHRRTVYGAIDRAARAGHLPPVMIPVLFPEDTGAQERLAAIVGGAHRAGVEVWGWEHVAQARELVTATAAM
jgi:hypothetical protein